MPPLPDLDDLDSYEQANLADLAAFEHALKTRIGAHAVASWETPFEVSCPLGEWESHQQELFELRVTADELLGLDRPEFTRKLEGMFRYVREKIAFYQQVRVSKIAFETAPGPAD